MGFDSTRFLIDFGYLPARPDSQPYSAAEKHEATKAAQAAYGLDANGQLTAAVERVFERTPRCAHPDHQQARNYISRWGLTHLTYTFKSYPVGLGLTPDDVRKIARESYDALSAVCGLTFEYVSEVSRANLVWSTGRGLRAGFDGAGGTLAFHYLPPSNDYRGQLSGVLDLDEPWSSSRVRNGISLFAVMNHETGHGLGLDHTNVPNQLMNSFYNSDILIPQAAYDIPQLQSRYGQATAKPAMPTNPAPSIPTGAKVEVLVRVGGEGGQVYGPQELTPSLKAALVL